nr:Chain C, Neuron-specific calcium-binding protein hippocalcin [Homo sapiens]
GKQNSKLR